MSQKTIKETMELSFPKILPHRGVLDYLKSRAVLNRIHLRTYQSDKARHDPDLSLIDARRTFITTEKELVGKREVYRESRKKMNDQWRELREKETEFKEMFVAMNHFIITNENKRIRAKERCQEDSQHYKERNREIEKLQLKFNFALSAKKEMDQEINRHKLYEKYLDQVMTKTEDFKNTQDLINRYESLVRTKNELGELQTSNMQLLEVSKSAGAKLASEYSFLILGLNNVVARLNSRYTEAVNSAMHWESIVCIIKSKAFQKYQEIIEVKQACWNIYKIMSKRKGETIKIAEDDLEKQMNYIKKTLREMKLVKEEAIHLSKKTFNSVKGQTSKVS